MVDSPGNDKSYGYFFFLGGGGYPLISKQHANYQSLLRCLDTVFQRPYRHFSIVLKVFFSLSDRYEIFTSSWRWIEICENVALSKIDITMKTVNRKQNGN